MEMPERGYTAIKRTAWNAGRTVGAKRALKPPAPGVAAMGLVPSLR